LPNLHVLRYSRVCLELRSLPSAGVTRFPRYYEPLRHPTGKRRLLTAPANSCYSRRPSEPVETDPLRESRPGPFSIYLPIFLVAKAISQLTPSEVPQWVNRIFPGLEASDDY
jgi:hypothetical protein